jgi:hypothetical protein
MRTCLLPATLAGGMRGLATTRDVAAGECVLSLPCSQLITYETAQASDLVRAPGRSLWCAAAAALEQGVRACCQLGAHVPPCLLAGSLLAGKFAGRAACWLGALRKGASFAAAAASPLRAGCCGASPSSTSKARPSYGPWRTAATLTRPGRTSGLRCPRSCTQVWLRAEGGGRAGAQAALCCKPLAAPPPPQRLACWAHGCAQPALLPSCSKPVLRLRLRLPQLNCTCVQPACPPRPGAGTGRQREPAPLPPQG